MNRLAIINKDNNLTLKTYEILNEYFANTTWEFETDIFVSIEEFVNKLKSSGSYLMVFINGNYDDNTFLYLRKKLDKMKLRIYIIIVTSNIYDGIKGYKINAFRCILNDEKFELNIYECLDTILNSEKSRKKLFEFKGICKVLSWKEIVYVESSHHKLFFHVIEMDETVKIYEMHKSMNCIEICSDEFMDVHKGYIVNLNYVKDMEQDNIILINDEHIPVSRNKRNEVKKRLEMILENNS